jgi:hypothetical protein
MVGMSNARIKLMLFLGSGISRKSGLPLVGAITDRLLNGVWHRHSDGGFLPDATNEYGDPVPVLQRFLKLLKSYADGYYALRSGQESNYEDLFYLAQQLRDDGLGVIDNPAILGFLTEVKSRTQELAKAVPTFTPSNKFADMVRQSLVFIRSVVQHELRTPDSINGLDLIADLAKSELVERLDIVTLNHDLLVEALLVKHGIEVCDGFDKPQGDVRKFNPELYDSAGKVRLFKLHGSLNWYGFRRSDNRREFYGIPVNGDVDHCKDADSTSLLNMSDQSLFLAGTNNKMLRYGAGIFAEMHYWFHRLLKEHNKVAVSGYGWRDLGITGRLVEWVVPPNGQRLYLMHQHPDDLAQRSNGGVLADFYGLLINEGRLHLITKWMQDVRGEELLKQMGANL